MSNHCSGCYQAIVLAVMITAGLFQACQPGNPSVKNQQMTVTKANFGTAEGREVVLYTLKNPAGMEVMITNYGGIVTSLKVPNRDNKIADVVLGFDSLQSYLDGHPYFGSIVGRYANRIAHGYFILNGKEFQLAKNNGENHLHGGIRGFDKIVWAHSQFNDGIEAGVILEYLSPDREEGYPGNLQVRVTYSLNVKNELKIDYVAETDLPTCLNLSHHSYFNLHGAGEGDVLEHELMIMADRFTVVNDQLIPTGELREVEGGPMDFRQFKTVGRDIGMVAGGYDHNFVLNYRGELAKVAELRDPASGRKMEVLTTQPGIQFYSGNFLDGTLAGKGGKVYLKHYGLCLETQHFPDSPNQPSFPPASLLPGEEYHHLTIYRFGTF